MIVVCERSLHIFFRNMSIKVKEYYRLLEEKLLSRPYWRDFCAVWCRHFALTVSTSCVAGPSLTTLQLPSPHKHLVFVLHTLTMPVPLNTAHQTHA